MAPKNLTLFLFTALLLFASPAHSKLVRDERSLEELKANAESGDTASQLSLSDKYAKGLGVEKDLEKANLWLRRAASEGNVIAQYNLARKSEAGIDMPVNKDEALNWYSQAAQSCIRSGGYTGSMRLP